MLVVYKVLNLNCLVDYELNPDGFWLTRNDKEPRRYQMINVGVLRAILAFLWCRSIHLRQRWSICKMGGLIQALLKWITQNSRKKLSPTVWKVPISGSMLYQKLQASSIVKIPLERFHFHP